MTSSNVSNLLVQVSQIDVSVTSDKSATQVDAGLFEKTLKGVASKVPNVDSNSALPERQVEKTTAQLDSSKVNRKIKQEEKSGEEKPELAEKIEAVVEEVKEVIKDQLDVDEENIEKAMENLGLTFIDLLNPQNLAQLVSELTGETESITLVLSDDFAGILDKVTELTNQLFEETNNSFIELKELIASMPAEEVEQIEVTPIPEDSEIPEVSEPKLIVDEADVSQETKQALSQPTQETLKPVEKQEVNTQEETTSVTSEKEVLKPVEPEAKENDSQFNDSKENNSQEQFKVPEKVQNESI
ncbi:MAG: hypothetical protein IKW81_11235, partial [Pseudobutyrivibrio sp.]|nr:hypothetical protein [Pseudobutyrivibrio sp.]